MTLLTLYAAALLFGGMTLFSFGFAAVLFKTLGAAPARQAIRGAFPYYYLFVIATAALTAGIAATVDALAAGLAAAIAVSTLYARQSLMHRINAATDAGDKRGFARLHGLSVALQLVQIALAAWLLARLV